MGFSLYLCNRKRKGNEPYKIRSMDKPIKYSFLPDQKYLVKIYKISINLLTKN